MEEIVAFGEGLDLSDVRNCLEVARWEAGEELATAQRVRDGRLLKSVSELTIELNYKLMTQEGTKKLPGPGVCHDAPFHFGKRQETGDLEKMSACKRSGPPSRRRKRFWNLRVVTRVRGFSLRHSSNQAWAKLTTTRRNRLKAKAALGLRTRLWSSPRVTSSA